MAEKTICVGIRTLNPNINCQTVLDARSLGLAHCHVVFETSKGNMGEVTNNLLSQMARVGADYYLVVDDDIGFSKDLFHKAAVRLESCDAVSAMPIPTDNQLRAYYTQMYSRYQKMDAEPFTFSFALLSRFVVENVRIPADVDAREEHAFYKELSRLGFTHHSVFNSYPAHLGKTAAIDARHNRWYAAGLVKQDPEYKIEAMLEFLMSPIEGFFYWMLTKDIFGLQHTVSLRFQALLGAMFGYQKR